MVKNRTNRCMILINRLSEEADRSSKHMQILTLNRKI